MAGIVKADTAPLIPSITGKWVTVAWPVMMRAAAIAWVRQVSRCDTWSTAIRTAALVALSALLAGYLLTTPQALAVRVLLVVYARVSVIATVALAGFAGMRAERGHKRRR